MDYSKSALPKCDRKADKARRDLDRERIDRQESAKVRVRSEGRCEVWIEGHRRCFLAATEVHHMINGNLRGKGKSALAEHKQHVCRMCHRYITGDIGGKKLVRVGGAEPLWTDRYRSSK